MKYARLEKVFGDTEFLRANIVSIVGTGALGSHAAQLLVRNGVHIKIFDRDIVEEPNLSSQSLYTEEDLSKLKAIQAREHLLDMNEDVDVSAFPLEINEDNIELVRADVVLDCTDNFSTRFLLNKFCKDNNIPLIHAAAIGQKGALFVVDDGPCLKCLYPVLGDLETCESAGITNMLASTVASLQVQQAVNILLDIEPMREFLRVDLESNKFSKFEVSQKDDCPVCSNMSEEKKEHMLIKPCKDRGGWSIRPERKRSVNLSSVKKKFKVVMDTPIVLVVKVNNHEVIVHEHGELIVKDDLPMKDLEDIGKQVFE